MIVKVEEREKGFSSMQPALSTIFHVLWDLAHVVHLFIKYLLSTNSARHRAECWDYVVSKRDKLSPWPLYSNGINQVINT